MLQNIGHLVLPVTNVLKSNCAAFLSHLDVVTVRSSAILVYLLILVWSLGVAGLGGSHFACHEVQLLCEAKHYSE